MSSVIGVVNYGIAGNIHSIVKALDKVGADSLVISSPEHFDQVDKIVIPGVGSFKDAMQELYKDELLQPLAANLKTKPTLGICLGMQILAKVGYEFGQTRGLGLFEAEVKKVHCAGAVPHMGFNQIAVQKQSSILAGVEDQSFYFMHSYEVVNYTDVLALTRYCDHQFVSAIAKDHLYGVQFHPEKSREPGLQVFKNFVGI